MIAHIQVPESEEEKKPLKVLLGKAAEAGQVKHKLNIRKSLNGNIIVYNHESLDIVLIPDKKKILVLPSSIYNDVAWDASSRYLGYLSKKGVLEYDSIRAGNVYGSLEGTYQTPEEGGPNAIDMIILLTAKWIEKEEPGYIYVDELEKERTEDLTDPTGEDSTELGTIPGAARKGTTTKLPLGAQQMIYEGLSTTVYHMTNLDKFVQILKTDKFMTSVAYGTSSDLSVNKKKLYYMSFMRSPQSNYEKGSNVEQVLLVLNGEKLGSNYKASPVDYWGPEYRKVNHNMNEMEDRIFTDKAWIPNATSYIMSARVLMDLKAAKQNWGIRQEALDNLKYVNGLDVPLALYIDPKSFRTIANKGMALEKFLSLVPGDIIRQPDTADVDFRKKYPKKPDEQLIEIIDVLKTIDSGIEYKDADYKLKSVVRRIGGLDGTALVSSWIHNAKSEPVNRPSIETIGGYIRKWKVDGVKGLIGAIIAWSRKFD
jgi:hypothetical protein